MQASPSDPQAHLYLGLALEKKRNWPAAYEEFTHASELDPHLSEPWRGQGATLLRMKKPAEAEAAYRKAVDIDHKYPVAVGLASKGLVQVTTGIKAGDRVIVRGQDGLPEGAAVAIEAP